MKALIVSPYLDHLGGGERYMLTVASVLEQLGYNLVYGWDNVEQIQTLSSMLGLQLNHIALDPKIKSLYFKNNPLAMYLATRPYDVVVYLSDGSFPLLGGKKISYTFRFLFITLTAETGKISSRKKISST